MKNEKQTEVVTVSSDVFVLPHTAEWFFRDLTDDQAGKLIKDLLAYHNRGVKRKYSVKNKVGAYFTLIRSGTEDMLDFYRDKGQL